MIAQIHSWPADQDRINEYLNSETEEKINVDFVVSKDANTGGLSAIEYLIFGKSLDAYTNETAFATNQLNYLLSCVDVVLDKANLYSKKWDAYEIEFKFNVTNNIKGTQNQLINTIIAKFEVISKSKLEKPLGLDTDGI